MTVRSFHIGDILTITTGRLVSPSHMVFQSPNRNSAGSIAGRIREGRVRCFEPAGDFDACTRSVDGSYRVYAWYVGDGGVQ